MIVNWICLQSLRALKHEIACMLFLADVFQDFISHMCELVCFQCSCFTAGVFNLFQVKEPLVDREKKKGAILHIVYIILCSQARDMGENSGYPSQGYGGELWVRATF